MQRHLLLVGAIIACCAGVAWSATAIPDDPIEYKGCIRIGFEEAFFVPLPNTSYEKWWITAAPDDFAEMMAGIPRVDHSRVMFARVYATVGPEGRYGHLGMGSREIAIGAIVELRQFEATDGSCAIWTPPPPVPPPEVASSRFKGESSWPNT